MWQEGRQVERKTDSGLKVRREGNLKNYFIGLESRLGTPFQKVTEQRPGCSTEGFEGRYRARTEPLGASKSQTKKRPARQSVERGAKRAELTTVESSS